MDKYLDLLNAMFFVESFDGKPFNELARKNAPSGGRSISGVTNSTWDDLKKRGKLPKDAERFDPKMEVRAGIEYFNWLLDRPYIKGDERKAVAAYHMGPTAFNRHRKNSGENWEETLPENTKTHLNNTYSALNQDETFKAKYEIETLPTYEPIIDVMYEMKNNKKEYGGHVKKHKIAVKKAQMGLLTPKLPTLQPQPLAINSQPPSIDGMVPLTDVDNPNANNGTWFDRNGQMIGNMAGAVGTGITSANMAANNPSIGAGAVGGALGGVQQGAAFGPWGMLAGGVLGGAMGAFNGLAAKTAKEQQDYYDRQDYIKSRTVDPSKGYPSLGQGGFIEGVEVQTEIGENVLLPDMSVVDVAARKKHKQMKDDEVTDLLPEGSYVFSNKIKLKKESAEGTILGTTPVVYKEGELPSIPEDVTMAEFFTKKENTPAEVAENIKNKFKISAEDNHNIFTNRTREENRISRAMRLPTLVQMNENAKPKKKQSTDEVPKAQDGWMAAYDSEDNKDVYQFLLNQSNRLGSSQNVLNALDFGQRTLMNMMQDPTETPFQERGLHMNQRFQGTPRSLYEYQINQVNAPQNTNARILQQSGVSPRDLGAMMSVQNAQRLGAISDVSGRMVAEQTGLDRAKYNEMNRLANANEQHRVGAVNQMRTNRNQLGRNQANITSGALQNIGSIQSSQLFRNSGLLANAMQNRVGVQNMQQNSMLPQPTLPNIQPMQQTPPVGGYRVEGLDNSRISGGQNLNQPIAPLPTIGLTPIQYSPNREYQYPYLFDVVPNSLPNYSNVG